MVSNAPGGSIVSEGIFTAFQFIQGNNYDILVSGSFYGANGSSTANGSFSVYAASGVSQGFLVGCQDPAPSGPTREAIYTLNAVNQNYTLNADLQTINQVSSNFSQIWIYPSDGTSSQVNLDLSSVFVCVSCNAVATYSSGTLPYQVNGKDITISIPAQPVATLVQVTDAVYLEPGFQASATNATFVAEISPCLTYTNLIGASVARSRDSSALADVIADASTMYDADSATVGIHVYPTLSKGTVILTGSAANLGNAYIAVLSETGKIVYQRYNAGSTTIELDLGTLGNGLYFIQIRQPSKVTTKKIIINK